MAFTIWRRTRLNALGITILLVGMGTGDFLYWRAGQNDLSTDADVLAFQLHSKAYQREMDLQVGRLTALLLQWSDALAEPKHFALAVMVASCATAGGCFWVASRQPH